MNQQVPRKLKHLLRCPDELRFIETRMGLTLQMRRSNALIANRDGEACIRVGRKKGGGAMFERVDPVRGWACRLVLLLLGCFLSCFVSAAHCEPLKLKSAAVLVYHRFGPQVADSMTTRTSVFEAQIKALRAAGYHIIALSDLVSGLYGHWPLPDKALAITVDDGHRSFYEEVLPIVVNERVPVTLFIYPSAISNASYAMNWPQLKQALDTGWVQIQSHTFWHPNFAVESRRMDEKSYRDFVRAQMVQSRQSLKKNLNVDPIYLAWPFGIFDSTLQTMAQQDGYTAAFALGGRHARSDDNAYALPRYLVLDAVGVRGLINLLRAGDPLMDMGVQ